MDFLTAREKAISIVSKMTTEEKMSQLLRHMQMLLFYV